MLSSRNLVPISKRKILTSPNSLKRKFLLVDYYLLPSWQIRSFLTATDTLLSVNKDEGFVCFHYRHLSLRKAVNTGRDTVSSRYFRPDISRGPAICYTSLKLARKPVLLKCERGFLSNWVQKSTLKLTFSSSMGPGIVLLNFHFCCMHMEI